MNIMIVSIMERTREIGILKAIGTKNRTVLGIFLSETLLIGLLGGVIGILVGWIIAELFGSVLVNTIGGFGNIIGGKIGTSLGSLTIIPAITPTLVIGALFFGIAVALIFGLYPAWRASRLKPLEALRYE